MRIYKEDYKHFRTCKKLTWFLNEQHYDFAKQLITDQKIINFVELTNTKSSSKFNNLTPDLNIMTFFDEEELIEEGTFELEEDYVGETLADGLETGKYAKEYFSNKYNSYDFEENSNINQDTILKDENYKVFFEARFQYDNCVTKCDILVRTGVDTFDLIEVKAVTWVKEEHMWDLLYQYDILTKSGIKISGVYLMHLNNKYFLKHKLDLESLFVAYGTTWQKSASTKKSLPLFESIQEELATHNLKQEYKIVLNILQTNAETEVLKLLSEPYCHDNQKEWCYHIFPYFNPFNTIFQLYRLRKKQKAKWYYEEDLLNFKDQRLLPFILGKPTHIRQYEIANYGEKVIDLNHLSTLKNELKNYQYPIYMYDFETMKSAVPKFQNTCSYQQIPFQYSVHILMNDKFDFKTNENIIHYEFLANGLEDPRITLVPKLVKDLLGRHKEGVYVAYNKSFEKSVLKSLAINFPEYAKQLLRISEKTIDLQDFFKDFKIYKSAFKGSLSIKNTLPAFEEKFSYQDLKIRKGDMASEAFRRRVENNISLANWNEYFRQNMIDYCARDTLGMVVLFWHIKNNIEQQS